MSTWILPCNIKKYDIEGAFAELSSIDWRQSINAEVGDVVYIYMSSPIQAIKYKCLVQKVNLSVLEIDDTKYISGGKLDTDHHRYMEIELQYSFEKDISFNELNNYGVKAIMGPLRASDNLASYLKVCELNDNAKDNRLLRKDIIDNVIAIKINKLYKSNMTDDELYEATRGAWKRKIESVSKAEYALAVANQIVVEVYKIDKWYEAGTFPMKTRSFEGKNLKGRIEFVGKVAADDIRNRYINKSVAGLYKLGEADPVKTFFKTESREFILDAANPKRYTSIFEALNECFGTEYTGWMKATWPNNNGNGNFRVWFPKLAETNSKGELTAASFDCVNKLSEDGNQIIFDDLKKSDDGDETKHYKGYDLVFAKNPKGGNYSFRGVFVRDTENSSLNHHVSKRIATKVKVIGMPANDLVLLDSKEENSINIPLLPKNTRLENEILIVTCGNCDYEFIKAKRCPECGQLIKYED